MNADQNNPLDELKEQLRILSEKRKVTAMLFYTSGDLPKIMHMPSYIFPNRKRIKDYKIRIKIHKII